MEQQTAKLADKARKLKLLLTDCDGVLTDGGVYYSAKGEELKRFSLRDGMGVERLRKFARMEVGIVSGEASPSLKKRAEKLRIHELHCGIRNKPGTLREIMDNHQLAPEEIAYIGDDSNDLEALSMVGLSACPADALPEVAEMVDYVCRLKGGEGAFREFCDLIISLKKKEDKDER